ncbi:MAG: EAL domain-containing protein [Firmicutes bacterium]|nr:EAL domain-containing protein [Bacillota bacterium]
MIQNKTILVVEDNAINREMLTDILSSQYTVLEAENGQEALEILEQSGEEIAIILLDVIMPVMDGYTFLDRIKQDAEWSLIPVIVMTQGSSENDEVTALAHGATDFVPKPYRPQVILHRIASIISLRETAAMANQFMFDRLTGLYSKEYFLRKARELLRENPDTEYTIVCSNVENFKLYNDTFGVQAGDLLLQDIAASLRKRVGKHGIYGRFNADRFVSLQERGWELVDRAVLMEEERQRSQSKSRNASLKWGIYEIQDRSIPVEQMCDRAMLAADSIKGFYNRRFAVYDDKLRSKLLREQAITDAMEDALEQGQFVVYLQPKYCLDDGSLAGAEALVRWIHPQWGLMPPGEFIPLFENNGFITRLDRYVWEQACKLLRRWKTMGYPLFEVSVNVSRADIYQADLVDVLQEIVQKYGVDPALLHLEITESAYTENPSQIISTVDQLRSLGFIVEMDDFGSGYSSLNMLSQLKLDVLKLDMKFIQSEMSKPPERGILRFIVELARPMDLAVVAEGVETWEQMDRLRKIGCDYGQGYYFAKPMPSSDFENLLKEQAEKAAQTPVQAPAEEDTALGVLLVVDENARSRKLIRQAYSEQYTILEEESAEGALARIASWGGKLSAVVLSATLPEGGAAAVIRRVREDPSLADTPILAMAPSGTDLGQLSQTLDVDDFAFKPWDQLCNQCLQGRIAWLKQQPDAGSGVTR